MSGADASVAANHDPWSLIKDLDVCLLHRMANDSGSAITNNLHIGCYRSNSFFSTDLLKSFELVVTMSSATNDCDVWRPANIFYPLGDSNWIIVSSAGY